MANQIITNYCNADCDFCFASDSRSRMLKDGMRQMDEAEVRAWLDFTLRGGIKELRLLGGEPTLHPNFSDFIRLGTEAGCTVTVFSNGAMPEKALEALADLDPENCTVVVNLSARLKNDEAVRLQQRALERLGPRVTLGMTVTSAVFDFRKYAAFIDAFGLKKDIRLGISNPTWGGSNTAVHPKRYPAVAQTLLECSAMTARHGITLSADCGFVRCMFGRNFDRLLENGFRYVSHCSPVVDLCSGGKIIPCFGLSNLISLKREDFPDAQAACARLKEMLKPWHSFGIYPECTECPYFETEECSGGCLAARLKRIQRIPEKETD